MRTRPVFRMLTLRGAAMIHDAMMGAAAFLIALTLRIEISGVTEHLIEYLAASILFGLIVSGAGFLLGMNRGVWRYASLPDLLAIVKAATVAVLVFVAAHFLLVRLEDIPRSSIVIAWAFLVILLAAPRAAYRLYRSHRELTRVRGLGEGSAKRVLLIGATDSAALFIAMTRERGLPFEILGIVDERGRRTGRFIHGVPVMGPLGALGAIVDGFEAHGGRPDALILTRAIEDYERHASLKQLTEIAGEHRLEMLRLPNLVEMRSMDSGIEIHPVRLEDLLQRPPVTLNEPHVASMVEGAVVLVTGAGGSIGSELVRQLARYRPGRLVLLDASEFQLYTIEQEIRASHPALPLEAFLCNVRERRSVMRVVGACRPKVIFHAAALKHVPIVEAQPLEGIFTNTLGTRHVAEAALECGAAAMVLVSTDKAVSPANTMGASKRMAEMFCQAMDLRSGGEGTRFVTVRFGNVLGSAGSVVPLFERQIKAGGPLTVTHPDIERYFMTIPEATLLVLQAAAYSLGQREQRGRIFVLDMGRPVKIVDLAHNLIRLSGLRPNEDIRIVFTGLRPGEKLYEELFNAQEALDHTQVPGLLAASPRAIEGALMVRILDEMQRMVETENVAGALRLLKTTVTDFTPGAETLQLMGSVPVALLPQAEPAELARQESE